MSLYAVVFGRALVTMRWDSCLAQYEHSVLAAWRRQYWSVPAQPACMDGKRDLIDLLIHICLCLWYNICHENR